MSNLTERLFRVLRGHPTINNKEALATALGCSRSMLHHYEKGNPEPPQQLLNELIRMEISLGLMTPESSAQKTRNNSEFLKTPNDLGFLEIPNDSGFSENPNDLGFSGGAVVMEDEKHYQVSPAAEIRDLRQRVDRLERMMGAALRAWDEETRDEPRPKPVNYKDVKKPKGH